MHAEQLKQTFTQYWEFLSLRAACQLDVFDWIAKGEQTTNALASVTKTNIGSLRNLLSALAEHGALQQTEGQWQLTAKGQLLTAHHPESLKQACILWGGEHLSAWQQLAFTVKTGRPVFPELYGNAFFDYISHYPEILKNYHRAMAEYARDDYKDLPRKINFSAFSTIADVGGGLGTLLNIIRKAHPHIHGILFETEALINTMKSELGETITPVSGNFFQPFPFQADAILLAKVLHDWDDEQAAQIIKNSADALNPGGKLFVIEILQDEIHAHSLSLNMRVICSSHERSFAGFQVLLKQQGFIIEKREPLNPLHTLIICQKQ